MSDEIVIYVTYRGDPDSRFDRAYYDAHHLPLVMQAWAQYGLLGIAAFYPSAARVGTIAICECRFRDEAAVDAAFASPETEGVMADVARFTDLTPARAPAVAL